MGNNALLMDEQNCMVYLVALATTALSQLDPVVSLPGTACYRQIHLVLLPVERDFLFTRF